MLPIRSSHAKGMLYSIYLGSIILAAFVYLITSHTHTIMDSWDVIEAVSASPQCPVTTQLTSTFSTVSYEYGAYTATHLPCKVAKLDFDTPSRRTDTLPTDFESIPAIAATDKASSEVRIVAPLLPGIVIDSGDAADVRPRSPVLPTSSPSPKSNIDNAGHIVSDSGSGGCPIGALAYARSQPRDIIPRTPLLLDQHCEADVMAQDDDGLSTRAPTMEFLSGHTHRSVEGTSRQTAAAFGPPTYDHQPEKERQAPNNNSLPIGGKKSTLSPSPPPSHQIPTGPKLLVVEPVLDVIVDADDSIVVESSNDHSSILDMEFRLVSVADELREVVEHLHLDVATREN